VSRGAVHFVPVGRSRTASCSKVLPTWAWGAVTGDRATRERDEVTCPLCIYALTGTQPPREP